LASSKGGLVSVVHSISPRVWGALVCPHCHAKLEKKESGAYCAACSIAYPSLANGQLDLRLQRPKSVAVDVTLGEPLLPPAGFDFSVLKENPAPAIDLDRAQIPWHLTRTLLSHIPRAKAQDALMLDLGCGDGVHKQTAESFGFEWVGLDYSLPGAPIRGDGHALPFADASFEFVLSIAVLEHIQFPLVMTAEVLRVLQPRGLFIGTVSFIEPFHNDSYYHHSHLATYNSLKNAGFEVLHVSPSKDWPGLLALSEMALFRMMPSWLTRILVWPLQALHRLWWWAGNLVSRSSRSSEEYRVLSTSGAFTFIARRPNP
jgi:SAM-dependent methyltransferase